MQRVKQHVKRRPRPTPAKVRLAAVVAEIGLRELARRLGVSSSFVLRLKRGEKLPGGALAARIQKATGIPAIDWYL